MSHRARRCTGGQRGGFRWKRARFAHRTGLTAFAHCTGLCGALSRQQRAANDEPDTQFSFVSEERAVCQYEEMYERRRDARRRYVLLPNTSD